MRPPSDVWRSALSIRLTKTCDSRSGSASTRTGRKRSEFERDAFVRCLLLERRDDRTRHLFQIDVAQRELQLPRLGTRLFEQLPDERGQAIDLRECLRHEQIARFLLGSLEHGFEHQLDRRERRAQLVRNVREKLLARAVEPNERRLIVGEAPRRGATAYRRRRSADRPRRDRFAAPGAPVSMSGATDASPRSASPIRRSSSTFGTASMMCSAIARAGSKPKVVPAAALANSTRQASVDQRSRRSAARAPSARTPHPRRASALDGAIACGAAGRRRLRVARSAAARSRSRRRCRRAAPGSAHSSDVKP